VSKLRQAAEYSSSRVLTRLALTDNASLQEPELLEQKRKLRSIASSMTVVWLLTLVLPPSDLEKGHLDVRLHISQP
jgi:hypothetical protein